MYEFRKLALGVFCGLICAPAAAAEATAISGQALQGYSGLLTVPDGGVMDQGVLDFQFNNDRDTDARAGLDGLRNYSFVGGLWPGLELGGRLSTARVGSRGDLSGSVKLRLLQGEAYTLAAGVADFAGDAQQLRARYLVGTVVRRGLQVSLGYGVGPDRLNGIFGGAAYRAHRNVELLADYDGNAVHAGVRGQWALGEAVSAYAIAKASSDARQSASAALGISVRLSRREPLRGVPRQRARMDLSAEEVTPPRIVETTQYPRDSIAAVRASLQADAQPLDTLEYRYGIPVRRFATAWPYAEGDREAQVGTAWSAQRYTFASLLHDGPTSLELRFEPDIHNAVGTEVGSFDYSLALRSSARLQLPAGLAGYLAFDTPLAHSAETEAGGAYPHFRQDAGLHQAAIQWALHPLPGLIGLNSFGRTEVDEVAYDFQHLDWALHSPSGRHQLRLAYAEFQPQDSLNFAEHQTRLAGYRYWWTDMDLAIRVDYGDFFFGDSGGRMQLDRYFGDTIVSLLYQRREDGRQVGGLQISLPLTGKPWRWKFLRVSGAPSWSYRLLTTIHGPGNSNTLQKGFMIEPLPQYTLSRDLLDADRAFPAYAGEGP